MAKKQIVQDPPYIQGNQLGLASSKKVKNPYGEGAEADREDFQRGWDNARNKESEETAFPLNPPQ